MSFIYSQALVAASLGVRCSDTDALPPLNGNPTLKPCLWHDKTTEPSRLSRFGMTCEPLTEIRGAELLTWWLAGFPVRTLASPGKAPASPEPVAECGVTWRGSLAKFDPVSSSWKTAQLCLLGDSELSLVIWPRSGMTADGQCWELPMSGRRTNEIDSGLWLGTPTATMSVRSDKFKSPGMTPAEFVAKFPARTAMATANTWPTPRCQMTRPVKIRTDVEKGHKGNLEEVVALRMWPTPTVCGNHNRKGASATSGDGLATAVNMWPTPQASDISARKASAAWKGDDLPLRVHAAGTPGALNPMWVEWLMGWPIGHTDLKQSEMGKSLCAPQLHSECSLVNLSNAA